MFEVEDKFKEDVIRDLKSKNLIVKEVLGRIVAKETDLYLHLYVICLIFDMQFSLMKG